MYMCPVCGYRGLKRPPENHLICPSCGTQFGYSDSGPEPIAQIYAGLRLYWVNHGSEWHSRVVPKPASWNAYQQLIEAKLAYDTSLGRQPTFTVPKSPTKSSPLNLFASLTSGLPTLRMAFQ
jgi:hypothetical protein